MFSRGVIGTLVVVMGAMLIFGGIAPPPAQANDTGRILAGLAAGAIVYGLLDDDDRDCDRRCYSDRDWGDRGFYNGNSGAWDHGRYGQRHNQDYGSRQYRRGYDHGFDDGRRVGYDQGWNRGYDYGYDRGYDRGRRSDRHCW